MRTLIVAIIVFLAQPVSAQTLGFEDRLAIEISPAFPEAGTPISVSARSLSLDLDRATLAWYVDGKLISEGGGAIAVSTTIGELGTKTTITVEAIGQDGEFLTATRVVQPAHVELMWESTSFVPPFYKGRRLPSSGSSVRVEAIPQLLRLNGALIPSRDIVFTWSKNGNVIPSASGRGKSTATFSGPELFGTDRISVEAVSVDSELVAAAELLIPSTSPFVLLYQDHPLFGRLYHRAIVADATLPDAEASFLAVPYFAGISDERDSRLTYAWRVNRVPIKEDEKNPARLTINAENSDGSARVELVIQHSNDLTMNARGLWRLLFNGNLGGTAELFGKPQ